MNTALETLFCTMRSEIGNAQQELAEVPGLRATVDALTLNRHHNKPHSLSNDDLIVYLVKRMTLQRLAGASLFPYDELCAWLPPLKRFRDALYSEAIIESVQLAPDPAVISDSRLTLDQFVKILPDQVFKRNVD